MAKFTPGVTVKTTSPFVTVDPGLRPGTYRFELVVVNQIGLRSKPQTCVVTIGRGIVRPIDRP